MRVHKNGIHTILSKLIFAILMVALTSACNKKQDKSIYQHYNLGETTLELQLQKTHYHLPNYIDFRLNIESNENIAPKVSIDKEYKKNLKLEHFQKNTEIASSADRLLHQYQFIFSAKQADTTWFKGFNIELSNGALMHTDSIQLFINSVLNNEKSELKPLITKLPSRLPFALASLIILLLAGGFYIYKKKLQSKEEEPDIEHDEKAELLKELKAQKAQALKSMQFDNYIEGLLIALKKHINSTEYNNIINKYEAYYKEQSFAQNQAESERQNKLISYLEKRLNKSI